MFRDIFYRAIHSLGLDKRDIEYLIRSEDWLTDEQIFLFSRFINEYRASNIFFTKYIGSIHISLKLFDIAIIYEVKNAKEEVICTMEVDFFKKLLLVRYVDHTLEVYNDLLDYKDKSKLNDHRMKTLNEILIRYYRDVLYGIYKEM